MRILGDIAHPRFKITLFAWNGKYLLKLEEGSLEQTYKIDEMDFTEAEVKSLAEDAGFLGAAEQQFDAMAQNLGQALQNL